MPSMEHKRGRGRGRPKGSGKTDGPSKAVKDHEPVRRSTRGKAAVRSQEDEVEAYEHEYHMYEFNHHLPSWGNSPILHVPDGSLSRSQAMNLLPQVAQPPKILLGKTSAR